MGLLEVLVENPSDSPTAIGVVCHPHPLFQGTMHNKVAYMLARSYKAAGMVSIRFNFRGVGKSEGEHDDGKGEVEDVLAVMAWAKTQWPNLSFNLAGFSFGAYVALQLSQIDLLKKNIVIESLITVAPPVGRWDFSKIKLPNMPWLIVQGLDDELVRAIDVSKWSQSFGDALKLVEVPSADHFFHGQLTVLREVVGDWLDSS